VPVEDVVDPGAKRARSGPVTTTTLAPAVDRTGATAVVGWMVLAVNPSALVTVVAELDGPDSAYTWVPVTFVVEFVAGRVRNPRDLR
jgi:hypothetical protein